MKKTFRLTLRDGYYEPAGVCYIELRDLFCLSDKPKKINIVISDKQLPESYLVNVRRSCLGYIAGIKIQYSDGLWKIIATSFDTDLILETLPDTFYVSVMA